MPPMADSTRRCTIGDRGATGGCSHTQRPRGRCRSQVVKLYGKSDEAARRYSPSSCVGTYKKAVEGNPDRNLVSTSHVERQNLTMRMSLRRFTRLTNAFSKKIENHAHAVALHFMHYNFCRLHQTLKITPAMAAGVTDKLWEISDIVKLVDEAAPEPRPRGPYKKRGDISN